MRVENKKSPAYTDLDVMPFGKHKNELLQDVPAHYFRWLWTDGDIKTYCKDVPKHDVDKQRLWILEKIKLANYIWNSQSALQQELNDTFI